MGHPNIQHHSQRSRPTSRIAVALSLLLASCMLATVAARAQATDAAAADPATTSTSVQAPAPVPPAPPALDQSSFHRLGRAYADWAGNAADLIWHF